MPFYSINFQIEKNQESTDQKNIDILYDKFKAYLIDKYSGKELPLNQFLIMDTEIEKEKIYKTIYQDYMHIRIKCQLSKNDCTLRFIIFTAFNDAQYFIGDHREEI